MATDYSFPQPLQAWLGTQDGPTSLLNSFPRVLAAVMMQNTKINILLDANHAFKKPTPKKVLNNSN